MKKSIYWQQRQYVGNYLRNLITQGETFHVINISWFSMKVYRKFCNYIICSSFSAGSIYKGAERTLLYMPNKILKLPRPFIVHAWHFPWRKFKAQYLDSIYVIISRFLKMYWGSVPAKNIMTLILTTLLWDYSWVKVKPIYIYISGQWNCISSWIQVYVLSKLYTDTYTNGKTLNGGRECVFRGKVNKT